MYALFSYRPSSLGGTDMIPELVAVSKNYDKLHDLAETVQYPEIRKDIKVL